MLEYLVDDAPIAMQLYRGIPSIYGNTILTLNCSLEIIVKRLDYTKNCRMVCCSSDQIAKFLKKP